jgi:hypothetical protein
VRFETPTRVSFRVSEDPSIHNYYWNLCSTFHLPGTGTTMHWLPKKKKQKILWWCVCARMSRSSCRPLRVHFQNPPIFEGKLHSSSGLPLGAEIPMFLKARTNILLLAVSLNPSVLSTNDSPLPVNRTGLTNPCLSYSSENSVAAGDRARKLKHIPQSPPSARDLVMVR